MIPRDTPHPYLHPADVCLRTPMGAPGEQSILSPSRLNAAGRRSLLASSTYTTSAGHGRQLQACITASSVSLRNHHRPIASLTLASAASRATHTPELLRDCHARLAYHNTSNLLMPFTSFFLLARYIRFSFTRACTSPL